MNEPVTTGSPVNGGRISFRRVGHRTFKPKDAPVIKSHSPLPWFERWGYHIVWVGSLIYTCYKVYEASLGILYLLVKRSDKHINMLYYYQTYL